MNGILGAVTFSSWILLRLKEAVVSIEIPGV